MNDRLMLLKAIKLDPADNVIRLAYADEIQDDDPARAEFIRLQIWEPKSGRIAYLFHHHLNYQKWIPQPFSPHEVLFERGFIARVNCPCPKFYHHSGVLFREGVIEKVKLRDRAADWDGPQNRYLWLRGQGFPQRFETWVTDPYVLPPEIFDNLTLTRTAWGQPRAEYRRNLDARTDLARAALAYGRTRAELEGATL